MTRFLPILLLALAACGADGEPETPAPKEPTGVTITGTVKIGVGS